MEITLTTPAMLFPAISLLLLAYTNRFVTIAGLIRHFGKDDVEAAGTQEQIANFRKRIQYIKKMQEAGVFSFFLCVLSMLAIYLGYALVGSWIFALSLIFLLFSLWMSVKEIRISLEALDVFLKNYKCDENRN